MLLILREEFICLVILIFLSFYYKNSKIKERGQPFWRIINYSTLYVIFDAITVITVNNQDKVPRIVNSLAHYIFYLLGILVGFSFYHYCVKICHIYKYEKMLKIIGYIPIPIYFISALQIPMKFVNGAYTNYSAGTLAFITFGIFLLYCLVGNILLFIFRKQIDDRVKNAVFPMMLALCISVIVQAFYPELLMTGASATFMCLGVFIALDNPDKKYKEQALWDFLTGLKNRNSYDKEIQMYENKKHIGILVADLNNLKKINDTYGHTDGDEFINTAANILKENLKSADNIYRIGGDEFIAVFVSPDETTVKNEIEQVRTCCSQIDKFPVPLVIAMGYHAGTIHNLKEMIDEADKLMYENKSQIKNKA